MSAALDDLRRDLDALRGQAKSQWEAVSAKKAEVKAAEESYQRIESQASALERYIHELDGVERNCRGHKYVDEPSGRGIGFDERCVHCGYFRTPHPVY